eukprot:14082520-Alexandrium_andersonii.AAC.1
MKQLLLGTWHVGVPPILGAWNGGLHVFRHECSFPGARKNCGGVMPRDPGGNWVPADTPSRID